MANILEGNYQGVSFHGQNLAGYVLIGNFTGADFSSANLEGSDLGRVTFRTLILPAPISDGLNSISKRGSLLSYASRASLADGNKPNSF